MISESKIGPGSWGDNEAGANESGVVLTGDGYLVWA